MTSSSHSGSGAGANSLGEGQNQVPVQRQADRLATRACLHINRVGQATGQHSLVPNLGPLKQRKILCKKSNVFL